MADKENIVDALHPNNNVQYVNEEGTICTEIVDAEMDAIECKFNDDGCVQIETEGYSYLTLSIDNLMELIEHIQQAEATYEEIYENGGGE